VILSEHLTSAKKLMDGKFNPVPLKTAHIGGKQVSLLLLLFLK